MNKKYNNKDKKEQSQKEKEVEEINNEEELCIEEEQITTEKTEAEELKDKLLRTMAEFDNFRKRTIKEKANMYDDGVVYTIEKFLPIIDNFERALSSSNEKEISIYKGIEMVLKQIVTVLKEIGIDEIDCIGKPFNPELHYAVAQVDDENEESNTIIEVMQKGYIYKEKVIRYSMVKVAN